MRRADGFTIVEMIVVLLLMTILAATVLGRAVTTTEIDLSSAADKVRNQIRYAQSMAMKTAHPTAPVWGVKFSGAEYWVFRGANPDLAANERRVPGGDYPAAGNRIREEDLKAEIVENAVVFFDGIGRPYTSYTDEAINTPLAAQLALTLRAGGDTATVRIEPETGLVR
ncbi:MAG: prepilin-type N-terminal cleavage/methylation domain-containing protein [Desulfobacterales bacterium]